MSVMLVTQAALVLLALALALSLRPWRLLAGGKLLTPLLASLVVLPWLWALPSLHAMPLQLQWSGACLVLLMLGWPLAIPVLCLVAVGATLIGGAGWTDAIAMAARSGEALPGVGPNLSLVAHWLTAWGDAFVTGMLVAVFVAYRPQWLATWSDALSLRR